MVTVTDRTIRFFPFLSVRCLLLVWLATCRAVVAFLDREPVWNSKCSWWWGLQWTGHAIISWCCKPHDSDSDSKSDSTELTLCCCEWLYSITGYTPVTSIAAWGSDEWKDCASFRILACVNFSFIISFRRYLTPQNLQTVAFPISGKSLYWFD